MFRGNVVVVCFGFFIGVVFTDFLVLVYSMVWIEFVGGVFVYVGYAGLFFIVGRWIIYSFLRFGGLSLLRIFVLVLNGVVITFVSLGGREIRG